MSIYQLDFCFPAVHKANWGQLTPAGLLGLIAFMDHGVSVAFLGSWIMAFYLSAKNPCRVLTVPAHFPEARLWIVSVGRPSGSYLVDSHPKKHGQSCVAAIYIRVIALDFTPLRDGSSSSRPGLRLHL